MLIAGWALLVGIVNIWLGRMTRRSMARLQLHESPKELSTRQSEDAAGLLLDPVSAELYESLRKFHENQQSLDAEVANRLRRAEHMASLGQLAAGLAHEIKNPLAGIRGVIELLRDESEDESNKAICSNRSSRSLIGSTEPFHSLLSFARPSLPQRVPTDVRGLIEGFGPSGSSEPPKAEHIVGGRGRTKCGQIRARSHTYSARSGEPRNECRGRHRKRWGDFNSSDHIS